MLTTQGGVEERIQKIISSAMTCQIRRRYHFATDQCVVYAVPREATDKYLTEYLKAFRELDTHCLWDYHSFEGGAPSLDKMKEGRNLLACCVLIERQRRAWTSAADLHLREALQGPRREQAM